MKVILKYSLFFFFLGFIIWELGPKPKSFDIPIALPQVNQNLYGLENEIIGREKQLLLKPDNEARFVWCSGKREKTPYSLVYLHGFGASQFEGHPIHRQLAEDFGMNAYLARLEGHGLQASEDSIFHNLDIERWINSALEAVAIGHAIGDSVILVSCSTGSTFSIIAERMKSQIAAHVMFSPNLDLYDAQSKVLTMPFGLQVANILNKGNIRTWDIPFTEAEQYWYGKQRMEGVVALRHLLNKTMTDFYFKKFEQPVHVQYWYANDSIQDQTISVERIREFENLIATPQDKKVFIALPNAGTHILSSSIFNPNWEIVYENAKTFLKTNLGIPVVETSDSTVYMEY